jgi:hypothetical protein
MAKQLRMFPLVEKRRGETAYSITGSCHGPWSVNQKGFYEFRLRSSNDNMTSCSPWSKTGSGTTFLDVFQNVQVSGFPHEFGAGCCGMPTPTTMVVPNPICSRQPQDDKCPRLLWHGLIRVAKEARTSRRASNAANQANADPPPSYKASGHPATKMWTI